MAEIHPKFSELKETAAVLIALSDDPAQVRTSTQGGFHFIVPEDVFDRYVDMLHAEQEPEPEKPAKRPGRPRKNAVQESEGE